jgi:hypothetical protein
MAWLWLLDNVCWWFGGCLMVDALEGGSQARRLLVTTKLSELVASAKVRQHQRVHSASRPSKETSTTLFTPPFLAC